MCESKYNPFECLAKNIDLAWWHKTTRKGYINE
jgi:hypothetical protein